MQGCKKRDGNREMMKECGIIGKGKTAEKESREREEYIIR